LTFLSRLFRDRREREALRPLYEAAVAQARDPAWYREGGVPDTLDGRFDMLSTILALVLLRLEGEDAKTQSVLLTEVFIDDMDRTLREIGIGDFVVGKRVGKLVSALGGRLGALRHALAGEGPLEPAVRRNVFRDGEAGDEHVAFVSQGLRALHQRLAATALEPLLRGEIASA
jgi:cytochrome b pre-mRNA-processing protein 3